MRILISLVIGMLVAAGSVAQDTLALPFAIADEKKLPEDELAEKREGTFVTGVPDLSSDPVNGFGYGLEGSITFNGKRSNPFFEYTPYKSKLDIAFFNTTRNQREFIVVFDHPYIFNSKWRFRAEAAYEINPNLLYFGITERTLGSLQTLALINGFGAHPEVNSYSSYENAVSAQPHFNEYTKEEYILNMSGEYSLLDSKMRILGGFEYARLNIRRTGEGRSLIEEEANAGRIKGFGQSQVTFLQFGVIYDTRDFESDPSNGVYAEFTDEYSNSHLLSDYTMNKMFLQVKTFKRLLPSTFKKFIFANRSGIGYSFGDVPFFEYQDEWSSEGSIEGLGGGNTLRGYKQNRFLDRGQYFVNTELRMRFWETRLWNQGLTFSAVPMFDFGSVYNLHNSRQMFALNRMRYSEGIGLRLAWNLSTILRFDYAVSKEDKQFFFMFEHAF